MLERLEYGTGACGLWMVLREDGGIHNPILLGSGKERILFKRAAFPLTWMTDSFC
jgi:hypothetical protein